MHFRGPLPAGLWAVLGAAHASYISVQSDFARAHSTELALAASMGWITTISPDGGSYGGRWRITAAGLTALEHNAKEAANDDPLP
jgi:hypothetical protein